MTKYVPSVQLLRLFARPGRRSGVFMGCVQCQHCISASTVSPSGKQYLTPEYNHERRRDGELQPRPLSRPLGLPHPPKPNQNTGRDQRTLTQKRDDFASYEKHKQRQAKIMSDIFERNYWRDVGNLGKVHKGKSILAPSTPFKAGVALYFPNLEGMTLEGSGIGWGKKWGQTTDVLKGKVSLVGMQHTTWAQEQVNSFLLPRHNPALKELMEEYEPAKGLVQRVTINVEENPLKAFMVRMFFGRMRRMIPREGWGTYFLNRRGLSEAIRDALAMWNGKVGYVYLLDGQCRIRWAANGEARPQERESLVRCVRRLVDEAKGVATGVRREEPRSVASEEKKQVRKKEQQPAMAAS